ncbi:hypothetical protein PM082_007074 [Marasmius tenuissimus]|nr:hypothetical protein PM082_007074 [Marasmius tenuissimus]
MSHRGGGDRGRGGGRGGGGGGGGGYRGGGGGGQGGYRGGGGGGGGGGYRGGGGGPGGGGRGDYRGGGRGQSPGRGRGGGGGGFVPREQGGVFVPPSNAPAKLDSRLEGNVDLELVSRLNSLNISGSENLPLRPGFGTVGTPIKLRTNFFPVKLPKTNFYEYDVSITPVKGTANRRIKRRIFQLAEQTPDWTNNGLRGIVAHDHSAKIIAAKPLPQPLTIRVPWVEEDEQTPSNQTYTLTIKYVQPLDTSVLLGYITGNENYKDLDVLPIISALNLILAAHPSRVAPGGGVMVGRNRFFFPSDMQATALGGGLEAFRGFYSSVRPSLNQLMVNVNVCTTAFYEEGNLAAKMIEFENASFGARMSAFVKGVRVKTQHLGYKKTVKALSNKTPTQHKFQCQELGNRTVTVAEYFRSKYQINLRYPNLPLVDVGGQKSNLLPPEICEILPNQPFRGKLLDDQTAKMITVAAKPPNVNGAAIVGPGLDHLGYRGTGLMRQFGVSIGQDMAVVPGRILPPPGIRYGQGHPRVDDRASWNLRDVKFTKGGTLQNWAVMIIRDGNPRDEFSGSTDPELRSTIEGFVKMCKTSGMKVPNMPFAMLEAKLPRKDPADPTRGTAIGTIRETIMTASGKPSFLFVILSNGDKHVYSGLKHLCDSYLDVPTVCVHSSKIRKEKGQLQYFANVALKVNMKLGGVNHALDQNSMRWLMKSPTMLVGIDVTHPGPGSVKGTPSIAAVVASIDQSYAQYPASMELQESKKEMVTNLASMMVERLTLFRARNNVLPARILVYRDGVSEGQFNIVVNEELPAIRAACRKYDTPKQPYRPKLTIVVCGKRHHTRFFPTDPQQADRDGNPKAGTVVDRGVTAVYNFDFFLQAHGGLQGTTKPTHYYVVHDDMNFTADELQTLTNSVSYMFARATKAVSLVSPAYYADLACERGRCYVHKLLHGSTTVNTNATDADQAIMAEAQQSWHGGVSGVQLKDTMYYL